MAPPLIVAADLWDTTILEIQQLFGFNILRALASLKGFKYKPCLNAYSEASITLVPLSYQHCIDSLKKHSFSCYMSGAP